MQKRTAQPRDSSGATSVRAKDAWSPPTRAWPGRYHHLERFLIDVCAVVLICIPIGLAYERWFCAEGDGTPSVAASDVTCEEIMEESVVEVTAFATVFMGVVWLLVAGVILGIGMLIARSRSQPRT